MEAGFSIQPMCTWKSWRIWSWRYGTWTLGHTHMGHIGESLSSAYPINCCYYCLYSSRRSVCLYSKFVAELVFSTLMSLKYEAYCGTSKDSCMWTYWGASTDYLLKCNKHWTFLKCNKLKHWLRFSLLLVGLFHGFSFWLFLPCIWLNIFFFPPVYQLSRLLVLVL